MEQQYIEDVSPADETIIENGVEESFTDEEIDILTQELENSVLPSEEVVEDSSTADEVINEYITEVDLSNVENLLEQSIVMQEYIYSVQLFSIGVASALVVCLVLYKFIKLFY